jgi:hypothetical protein
MSSLGAAIDVVQTVAIIALTVVVALSTRHMDRRLRLQHIDVQDAIVSQYAILRQIEEQRAEIDKLGREMDEKCGQLDQRIVLLEIPKRA